MEPATVTAAITLGRVAFQAGKDVYSSFQELIRKIPGLDAVKIDQTIRSSDVQAADQMVDEMMETINRR